MTTPFKLLVAVLSLSLFAPFATIAQPEEPPAAASPSETLEIHADDQGRRYRLVEYPKGKEGVDHLRMPNGQLRIQFGLTLDIDHETEESFFLRVFVRSEPSTPESTPSPAPPLTVKPTDEAPTWPLVDRLLLTSFDDGLPKRGQWRDGFDLADMNGDGRIDIVFGPARKGRSEPNIFLNLGGGRWQRWQTSLAGLPLDYGDAAAADFDRDGHMDLALAVHLTGVVVVVGDGEGRFRAWSKGIGLVAPSEDGSGAFSSRAIEAVDWDGDGWTDLVVLGEGPRPRQRPAQTADSSVESRGLLLYRNRGDGTWDSRTDESGNFGESLAIGDFNDDNRVDVLTASKVQGFREIVHLQLENGDWLPRELEGLRSGAFAFAVAAADLDRDGLDDLLVGSVHRGSQGQRTGVDAFYASKDGPPQRVSLFDVEGRTGIYGLASGDVNGDGFADVAFGTGDGEMILLVGGPNRTFSAEASPELQHNRKGCRAYGLRLADLDADGSDELIAGFAGEEAALELLYTVPGCEDGGSIRVWRPVATPTATVPPASL